MKKGSTTRRNKNKVDLKLIKDVARSHGINKKYLTIHGDHVAKVSLDLLRLLKKRKKGKYILLSSITPSPFGEGKTTTGVGLAMAFKKLKKKAFLCITQPSLNGIFASKLKVSGRGSAQIFPKEEINLHFTGDNHAVMTAHNLCAAYLDNSIYNNNPLDIKSDTIIWNRVIEASDRSLRNVNTGLGGKADGISRKTGFESVASSELIGILTLASSVKDLRERIGKIIVAFTAKGKPITTEDIKVAGAMTVLLKDAIKPNLVQTSGNTPCFVHAGASNEMSLGTSSVAADTMALGLGDYAISETEFGAESGAEKFFDIKCRTSGLKPDVAVLVCSVRAFKMHSGDIDITETKLPRELARENISAVERGLSNLEKQIENLRIFGIPVVVCINRFNEDSDKEIHAVERRAVGFGADSVCVSRAA